MAAGGIIGQFCIAQEEAENAVFSVVVSGDSGSFKLALFDYSSGNTTTDIAVGASSATVLAALEGCSGITAGDVSVGGTGTSEDPYILTFEGNYALNNVAIPHYVVDSLTKNAVQNVVVLNATGGTFLLKALDYTSGNTTTALAFDLDSTALAAALNALDGITPDGVTVTGTGTAIDPFVVTCANALANTVFPTLLTDITALTGDGATVTVTVLDAGDDPVVTVTETATGGAGYGSLALPGANVHWQDIESETIKHLIGRIVTKGLRPGRKVFTKTNWSPGIQTTDGPQVFPLQDKGLVPYLLGALGTVTHSQPDATNHPLVNDYAVTIGDLDGLSFSAQAGRPGTSEASVEPFTWGGGKIDKFEVAYKQGNEYVTLTVTWFFQSESITVPLLLPSYPVDVSDMSPIGALVERNGVEIDTITDGKFAWNNQLDTGRHHVGTPLIAEPLETKNRVGIHTLTKEFESLAEYTAYVTAEPGSEDHVIVKFVGAPIDNTYDSSLTIDTPAVRWDDVTQHIAGAAILPQVLTGEVIDNEVDEPITITYRTSDAPTA